MNPNKTAHELEVSNMIGLVNGGECTQLLVGLAKMQHNASRLPVAILFDVTHCSVYYCYDRSIKQCSLHKDILRGKGPNLADETNYKYSEKQFFKITPNML